MNTADNWKYTLLLDHCIFTNACRLHAHHWWPTGCEHPAYQHCLPFRWATGCRTQWPTNVHPLAHKGCGTPVYSTYRPTLPSGDETWNRFQYVRVLTCVCELRVRLYTSLWTLIFDLLINPITSLPLREDAIALLSEKNTPTKLLF